MSSLGRWSLPLFGCLTVIQVLLGRPFVPVRWGESFILVARKTAEGRAPR